MANVTADIEQLLAELVQITTKIAALMNSTDTNGSDDSDSLTSNANRLSLSAAIIAVAAFFIASLQAILEYSSSGESARHKCNQAAIGPFSKYVVKKWSFRHWRWKFYYPVLDLDLFAIFVRKNPGRATRILAKTRQLVSSHRSRPELESRPRATWAQLMSSIDAVDESLIMSDTRLDVDSIPGSLDVPPQIIDLVTLGMLAVYLNCDSVSIDVRDRDFKAVGNFGTITTEELAGFGKVVRFQTYRHTSDIDLIRVYHSWYRHVSGVIKGRFDTDDYFVNEKMRVPGQFIDHQPSSLMRNEASQMVSALNEVLGSDILPDDIYKSVNMVSSESAQIAFTNWRGSLVPVFNNTKFPSILVTLAIAFFPCGINGFPGRSLLLPFLIQCRQISEAVFEQLEKVPHDEPNDNNQNLLDPHLLILFEHFSGHITTTEQSLWAYDATAGLKARFSNASYSLSLPNHIPESELGEEILRQGRVILPPIVDLIKNFDPRLWAQSFTTRYQDSEHSIINKVLPAPILPIIALKTQIVLLDVRIHCILNIFHKIFARAMDFNNDGESFSLHLNSSNTFIYYVREAILKSLSDDPLIRSKLFENFDRALISQICQIKDINQIHIATEHRKFMSEVGDLLALRVVLYAACLMIVPDTSDILETQISVGRGGFVLPMI